MKDGIKGKASYANVVATAALFLALGGGAYAAVKLPASSVGTKQIKRSAVISSKVKNRSLLKADFKSGQLPKGSKGDRGAVGPPGPSASSFSSHDPSPDVEIGTVETQVITLTDGSNAGLLTIGFGGRILANGSIFVENQSAATRIVFCRLKIAPQGGAFTPISRQTASSVPSVAQVQIPLAGAVDEPAGAYNVQVACLSDGTNTVFRQGDLTALATAR